MTQMLGSAARNEATVVERPRAGDAIGIALRDAYTRDLGLPDDLAALLGRLDHRSDGGYDERSAVAAELVDLSHDRVERRLAVGVMFAP